MTESAVRAAFRAQAASCAGLGSPFMARLLALMADRLQPDCAVAAQVLGWQGDAGGNGDSVPLRLGAGLHALALGGTDDWMAQVWAAPSAADDAATWRAVVHAMHTHEAHLMQFLANPPQTNELRRSAAMITAGHWLAARFGLPLVLSEAGSSAGLNLLWDGFALDAPGWRLGPSAACVRLNPEWRGPPPPLSAPHVHDRAGVDLNPLHPVRDRLRILSYIWADQPDRLARTRAALDLAASARPSVARGDAVDWLASRLARPLPGMVHMVFHTVVWQYLPQPARDRGEALLRTAGARATVNAPVARMAMEADQSGHPGAALTLDIWPDGRRIVLGRIDFHGRWVNWDDVDPMG